MKAAKDIEKQYYDPIHQKNMQERTKIRLGLWEAHLKSPAAALAKALECLEQHEGEPVTASEVVITCLCLCLRWDEFSR